MSLVNISLVGNVVRPPEQMYFASGRVKTTVVVAINNPPRNGRSAEVADFYRVETWGKLVTYRQPDPQQTATSSHAIRV